VQAEIEAFEWIVAEQKVTLADPRDYDVYGWASGLLVQFEIRDGCLSGWRTRACTEAAEHTHVAATPTYWANFTQRNAELAARLAI
jgi:excinuclease ABC subunit C